VADDRRLNVGLTRARSTIIVIGHLGVLSQDFTWQSLIEYCKNIKSLVKITGCKKSSDEENLTHFLNELNSL